MTVEEEGIPEGHALFGYSPEVEARVNALLEQINTSELAPVLKPEKRSLSAKQARLIWFKPSTGTLIHLNIYLDGTAKLQTTLNGEQKNDFTIEADQGIPEDALRLFKVFSIPPPQEHAPSWKG